MSVVLSNKLMVGLANRLLFWCPGCDSLHGIYTQQYPSDNPRDPKWGWDGDVEKPTFAPSILVTGASETGYRCHSFVRGGKIEYLNDCSHKYRGQTIDMPDIPEDIRW